MYSDSRIRSYLVLLVLLVGLSACERAPRVYQQQVLALGTIIDISLYGVTADKAQVAVAAVTKQMQLVQHQWHAWQPSRLTDINKQLQAGHSVRLAPDEVRVMHEAMTLSKRSDYLFNPAIGKMVALWGFHTDVRPDLPPPSQAAIQALLQQHPSMADLSLQGDLLSSRNPAVQLDFGGFAKGIAIDLGIAALRRLGINNAIVNAGGDMRVIGSKGGQPWRIGIRHPRASGVIASVEMQGDESIYTSGDYERFFDYHGKRYHHIIDPRTGMPAPGVTSVTVIHTDAATAEAADKALFIAGPAGFAKMAAQLGITQAMLIDSQGTVYMTTAMAKRIHFEIIPAPETVVVNPK
jgi:thiamine biosynthesis lipoprotein